MTQTHRTPRLTNGANSRQMPWRRGFRDGWAGEDPEWYDNDRDRQTYLAGYAAGKKEKEQCEGGAEA